MFSTQIPVVRQAKGVWSSRWESDLSKQGLANQIIASLGMWLVTITDKRRQQEIRVAMLLSLKKLTSVGRQLNWCGRQQHTSHYGENCVALRGQRANHA